MEAKLFLKKHPPERFIMIVNLSEIPLSIFKMTFSKLPSKAKKMSFFISDKKGISSCCEVFFLLKNIALQIFLM